jgi:hypothetical protein
MVPQIQGHQNKLFHADLIIIYGLSPQRVKVDYNDFAYKIGATTGELPYFAIAINDCIVSAL